LPWVAVPTARPRIGTTWAASRSRFRRRLVPRRLRNLGGSGHQWYPTGAFLIRIYASALA
jgi:hypothetical protein